jgi:hypothetical protein
VLQQAWLDSWHHRVLCLDVIKKCENEKEKLSERFARPLWRRCHCPGLCQTVACSCTARVFMLQIRVHQHVNMSPMVLDTSSPVCRTQKVTGDSRLTSYLRVSCR